MNEMTARGYVGKTLRLTWRAEGSPLEYVNTVVGPVEDVVMRKGFWAMKFTRPGPYANGVFVRLIDVLSVEVLR